MRHASIGKYGKAGNEAALIQTPIFDCQNGRADVYTDAYFSD